LQATKLGRLAIARHAFERGLRINPNHPLLLGRLLDVALALGDWEAAGQVMDLAAIVALANFEEPLFVLAQGDVWGRDLPAQSTGL
jgi:hypothetical protein